MELLVKRKTFSEASTIGELSVDGKFECYTLEDTDRKLETGGVKIPGKTAIPRGRYQVALTFSNRFQKYLPEVLNVPGFAGIRIHPGNKAEDTEGCLLVGTSKAPDFIGGSRDAFTALFAKLKAAEKKEKIFITYQ